MDSVNLRFTTEVTMVLEMLKTSLGSTGVRRNRFDINFDDEE